jgi:hypothetical protein
VQETAGSKDSSTAWPGMQGLISAGESHRPSRSRRTRDTPRGNPQGSPRTRRWRRRRVCCARQLAEPSASGSRGSEHAGKPANSPSAMPEEPEDVVCGKPRTHQTTRRLGGVAVEEMRGNPEIHRLRTPKEPKDEGFEAPRSSIAGTAERCRTRGNSRTHWETEREDV